MSEFSLGFFDIARNGQSSTKSFARFSQRKGYLPGKIWTSSRDGWSILFFWGPTSLRHSPSSDMTSIRVDTLFLDYLRKVALKLFRFRVIEKACMREKFDVICPHIARYCLVFPSVFFLVKNSKVAALEASLCVVLCVRYSKSARSSFRKRSTKTRSAIVFSILVRRLDV